MSMAGKKLKGLHRYAFPSHLRTKQICALPIKSNLKLTLFALSERVDAATGETWAGAEILAPLVSLSVRRFRQHLNELVKLGLLEERAKTVDGKTCQTRIFRLVFLRPDPGATRGPPTDWPKVDKTSTQTGQNVHPDRTECPPGPDKASTNQDNIQKGSRNLSEAENFIFQPRQERAEPPALDPDELEQKAVAYVHKLRGLAKELGPEKALAYARQSCDGTHKDTRWKDVQIVKRALELWHAEEAQAEERPRLKAGMENGRSNHKGRTVAIFTGPLKPVLLRLMWDDMARPGFHLQTPP